MLETVSGIVSMKFCTLTMASAGSEVTTYTFPTNCRFDGMTSSGDKKLEANSWTCTTVPGGIASGAMVREKEGTPIDVFVVVSATVWRPGYASFNAGGGLIGDDDNDDDDEDDDDDEEEEDDDEDEDDEEYDDDELEEWLLLDDDELEEWLLLDDDDDDDDADDDEEKDDDEEEHDDEDDDEEEEE